MSTEIPIEQIIMTIIVESGEAKSDAFESIQAAKQRQIDEAEKLLTSSKAHLLTAHRSQTDLLQKEAGGKKTEVSLLMVHAQDHLMTAMAIRDLAAEFVDLYKQIQK